MRKIVILALALLASIYWQGLDNVKAYDLSYVNGGIFNKNSNDTGTGENITPSISAFGNGYSSDGRYILYQNFSDNGYLYKKNANDTLSGSRLTTQYAFKGEFSPDGQYIIYHFADGGGNFHLYKKNANDTSNGTEITSQNANYGIYSPDGQYIIYINGNDNGYLWRKNANDTSNGVQINTIQTRFSIYSSDGQYIYYAGVDGYLYKKNANDTGNGVQMFSVQTNAYLGFTFSPDGQYIVYTDGGYLKRINIISENIETIYYGNSYMPVYIPLGVINGTCGTNATTFSTGATRYTGTFCSRGTASPTTPDFPLGGEVVSWSCLGSNSGSDASCSAYKEREILTPVNASCGTNVGTYHSYYTRYTGTFCSRGTASPTTPSFPGLGKTTTWICEGIYGGNNISCSASKNDVVTPLNGSCGTSAKVYTTSDTRYTGTFCSRGTASPSTPSFPTSGNSISWSCNGIDGGVNMSCIASKETDENILGQCGTRRRMYGTGETRFDGTFCSRGAANPSSLSFPDIGRTVYWTCDGSFGYLGSVSCSAVRQGDGTTGTTFLGIDWSFISKPLDKISQAFYNFIHFEANWLGFNFDFDSLENLFSLNLKGNTYTVNNSSCANMLNNRITYQHNTWNYNGGIGNNGKGVFTSNTETCNVIRGTITHRSINNGGNILSSDFRVSNGDICSVNTTLYNDGTYWANDTTQIENGFSYLTKTNTNDIINFNETIIQNIRIIPFSLVLFGFDLRQFLNTSITGLIEIIINIIIYPINILNVVYQDFSILFIQDFPATYCYYGMTISKITFTPTNYISNDIPYTSNLGIGIFVMIIFTISALAYLFKKFF